MRASSYSSPRSLTGAIAVLMLVACGQPAVPAAEVRLEQLMLITPGDAFPQRTSLQLKVFGLFSDGRKVDLTAQASWSSSDEQAVLITNDGVAVLRGVGSSTITASWGLAHADQVLTSREAALVGLNIMGGIASLPAGQSLQLRALATTEDGVPRDVTSSATWSSAGVTLLPAGAPGLFSARLAGAARVQASFGGLTQNFELTVTPPLFDHLTIVSAGVMHPGDATALVLQETASDGSVADVTAQAQWSSSSAAFSVQGSTLTAIATGRATITATWNGHQAATEVLSSERAVQTITLVSQLSVAKGLEADLDLRVVFADGSTVSGAGLVSVSSSDPSIATVSAQGIVHAVAEGRATVHASLGQVQADATIEITPAVLQSIRATLPAGRMAVGQQATVAVWGHFSDSSEVNLSPIVNYTPTAELSVVPGASQATVSAVAPGVGALDIEIIGRTATVALEVTTEAVAALEVVASGGSTLHPTFDAWATWTDARRTLVTEFADWSSVDDQVAAIDSTAGLRGHVDVVLGGSTTLTAHLGSLDASVPVTFTITP